MNEKPIEIGDTSQANCPNCEEVTIFEVIAIEEPEGADTVIVCRCTSCNCISEFYN